MIPPLIVGAAWPYSLLNGSEMGTRVFEYDWARTPLGPIDGWDQSIRDAVSLSIKSEFPMFVFVGHELIQIYNDAAIAFTVGKHPEQSFARPWAEAWSEVAGLLEALLLESINSDKSLLLQSQFLPILRNGRMEEAYITFSYSPFRDQAGAFRGVHCITLEVTATVLATRRLNTLQQVVRASASQAFEDTCRRVAAVLANDEFDVPFAALYRYDGPALAQRIAVSGAAASDTFFPATIEDDATTGWPIEHLSLERPVFVRFPRPALGDPPAGTFPEPFEQAVLLPLSVGRETAGLLIAGVNPRLPLAPDYRRFFVAIASEMSTALTSTAAHDLERLDVERQLRASQSFQDASLPRSLPEVPGVDFDAIYVPASDEAKVGGDWYDAVRLSDGRIVVSIGDVAGHGLLAAVTMGNIRQIIRGIAQVHADPALMLEAADRALRLEYPDTYVTAWVGVIDLVGRSLTFASAGHPPPFLRTEDGKVEQLSEGGLPLGLRGDTDEQSRMTALSEGCVLFLYTDGLTEAWRDAVLGEKSVAHALATADAFGPTARDVHAAVIGDSHSADDIAIMTVHVRRFADAQAAYRVWDFQSSDRQAALAARREFADALARRAWRPGDIANAETVLGELIANVVRYAAGPLRIVLDLTSPTTVLHVLDSGPGFERTTTLPSDTYSESGRGLFIVEKFGRDLLIRRRVDGGSHASVIISKARSTPSLSWSKTPNLDARPAERRPKTPQ